MQIHYSTDFHNFTKFLDIIKFDNNTKFYNVTKLAQVRREPEIQELRQWQKAWREEREDLTSKVSDFWSSKMPSDGSKQLADETEPPAADDGQTTDDVTEMNDGLNTAEVFADVPVSES